MIMTVEKNTDDGDYNDNLESDHDMITTVTMTVKKMATI
jgi:hypothetical protein